MLSSRAYLGSRADLAVGCPIKSLLLLFLLLLLGRCWVGRMWWCVRRGRMSRSRALMGKRSG